LWICVSLDSEGTSFSGDSNDYGSFTDAFCTDEDADGDDFEVEDGADANTTPDDRCEQIVAQGEDDIEIVCGDGAFSNCWVGPGSAASILLQWTCEATPRKTQISLQHVDDDEPDPVTNIWVTCVREPDAVTVTASPTVVEIVPALGSVAHSEITVAVSGGGVAVNPYDTEIDITVPKCAIEIGIDDFDGDPVDPSPLVDSNWDPQTATTDEEFGGYWDVNSTQTTTTWDHIWFHADYNKCTPGDVVVTVVVEVDGGADIVRNVTINVVGPPAFITATAAPTSLICGEKSTITVKVTDAIGQNVSDNTQVELISNWGSVIAGTGATLAFPGTGPVNPLASSAAATYNGVAVAYLLTSDNHVGPYEVVAAAGGTLIATPHADDPWYDMKYSVNELSRYGYGYYGHSDYVPGAPITTQVTVTCSQPAAPAPTVTAPTTGTGSITPPNTGDAGLASSSSNGMLFVVIGAAAFVLAGIASVSYARR
jgi:hypothetical protein